ncbi:MAG: hypothetical protein KAV00_06595, partial [Phycisphaerae bacterium]|nr:hypothetical protein [Phycisphaerae bacterium]
AAKRCGLVAAKYPDAVAIAHILNSSRFPSPHFPFFIFNFQLSPFFSAFLCKVFAWLQFKTTLGYNG